MIVLLGELVELNLRVKHPDDTSGLSRYQGLRARNGIDIIVGDVLTCR